MENMIGQRIKTRRKELNITQTQIQEKTGISSGNLSGIENGRYLPSTVALIGLSEMLDCSIDWILTGKSSLSTSAFLFDNKDLSDTDLKLIDYFHNISLDDQEEILMLAELKYNKSKRKSDLKSSPSSENNSSTNIA